MRTAVAFLTVLPVGRAAHAEPRRSTMLAFPVVGLALGAAWAGVAWGAAQAWDPFVAAALVIAFDLAITGALHADSVADVVDGVASRRPPEEALAIMREPQVGAVGAVASTVIVVIRLAFVASLAAAELWTLIAVAPVCGRAAMVAVLAPREARSGSLARGYQAATTPAVAGAAAAIAAVAALAAGVLAPPDGAVVVAVAALVAALAAALAFAHAWRRRFGSLNGDAAGCAGVAAEVVALAVLALTPAVTG